MPAIAGMTEPFALVFRSDEVMPVTASAVVVALVNKVLPVSVVQSHASLYPIRILISIF